MYKDSLKKSDPYADFFDVRPRPQGAKPAIYQRKDTKESLHQKLKKDVRLTFLKTSYKKLYPILAFIGFLLKGIFFAIFFPPYFLLIVAPRWFFGKAIPRVCSYITTKIMNAIRKVTDPIRSFFKSMKTQLDILKTRFREAHKRVEASSKNVPLKDFVLIKDMRKRWDKLNHRIQEKIKAFRKRFVKANTKAFEHVRGVTHTSKQAVSKPIDHFFLSLEKKVLHYQRVVKQFVQEWREWCGMHCEKVASYLKNHAEKGKQKVKAFFKPILEPFFATCHIYRLQISKTLKIPKHTLPDPSKYLSPYLSELSAYFRLGKKKLSQGREYLQAKEYAFRRRLGTYLWALPKKAARHILYVCEKIAYAYRLVLKPPLDLFDRIVNKISYHMKIAYTTSKTWIYTGIQTIKKLVESFLRPIKRGTTRAFQGIGKGSGRMLYWSHLAVAWSIVLYEYGLERVQSRAETILEA